MNTKIETLNIRKIRYEDLPDLEWGGKFTHFRRLYSDAFQNQQKGNTLMWAAELNGNQIIGQAFVQLVGSRLELANGHLKAYIYSVRVQSQFRNLGVGTKIMKHTEVDLAQRGFSYATLNVSKKNPDAQRFYERQNYQIIGEESGKWSYLDHLGKRRYVHDPSWRMQKLLRLSK